MFALSTNVLLPSTRIECIITRWSGEFSSLKPSLAMPEKCTNRSSPPSAGLFDLSKVFIEIDLAERSSWYIAF